MPSASPLQQRVESLYGLPCPLLADPQRLRALVSKLHPGDDIHFTFTGFGANDPGNDLARHALKNNPYSPFDSDLFGFMTNALMIAIPYRHEAIWLDLEPSQSLWKYAEGWSERASLGTGSSRFPELRPWAYFLWQLLPDYDSLRNDINILNEPDRRVEKAYDTWLSSLNAPSATIIAQYWDENRSRPGCADALICLLSAFFLGATPLLVDLLDDTASHPSEVVQSVRLLLHSAEWEGASDRILAHLQRQRAAFVAKIAPPPVEHQNTPYTPLVTRFPGALSTRVLPERAFRKLSETSLGGREWYLNCDSSSGLSPYEAMALLEAPATPQATVAGLSMSATGIVRPRLQAFIGTSAFEPIRYLSTDVPLSSLASVLAASPYAANLEWLGVKSACAPSIEQLGNGRYSLKTLHVSGGGNVGVEGFRTLAKAPAFGHLQELVLSSPHCKDEGMRAWLASDRTRHLRVVSIPNGYSGACVDGAGESLAEWLASPLPHLTQLNLTDHRVGDRGAAALAGNSNRVLRSLILEGCGLSPHGVATLLLSPVLSSLESLSLHRTLVGAEGAEAIAQSPHLEYLNWVRLGGIGDDGAVALAKANLPFLDSLDLERGDLGSAGVCALVNAPWLPSLKTLMLTTNRMDTESAVRLGHSNRAGRISFLSVSDNPIGREGVEALLRLPSLQVLRALFCGVPRSEFERLQKVRPDVLLELA